MSRFVPFKFANQAVTQQVQISDRIQNLVLNEFILIPQTVFVQDFVIADGDRVIHTRTQSKVPISEFFEFMHEAKGSGPTHLFHKGGT